LKTYWGAFWEEYGQGGLGDDRAIWPHWKGEFPGHSSLLHPLMCPQVIAIVMDNASNNNTLMMSLE